MGVAITLLRTAAIVGAGLLTNHQTHQAVDTASAVKTNIKKNATGVFVILFLRDLLRSLIVTFFIGVASIVATVALENEALLRAASYFSAAMFCLIAILTAVLFAGVKELGKDISAL